MFLSYFKKKKKMSTPLIPLIYDKDKDLPTNILTLCSVFLILIIIVACFYPLCCRRSLNLWIERRKAKKRREQENDDASEMSVELSQTLL